MKVQFITIINEIYKLGHRKIAFVQMGNSFSPRTTAYRDFMSDHGLRENIILLETTDMSSVFHLGHEILSHTAECTAMVAEKDTLALTICDCLDDAGIKVLEDISVAGFDDLPESATAHIPLTTVRQDIGILKETALNHLNSRISGNSAPLQCNIDYYLIIRDSIKKIIKTGETYEKHN